MTILAFITAYLLGALPISLLIAKLNNLPDPRSYGSGNIGATNIGRQSKLLGVVVFLCDACKVYVALAFSHYLMISENYLPWIWAITIIGQTRSIFLNFTGGKGVSCYMAGMYLLMPSWFMVIIVIFSLSYIITRQICLASISFFLTILMLSATLHMPNPLLNMILVSWIIYLHSNNMIQFYNHFNESRKQTVAGE